MISIQSIEWRNFLGYGDYTTKIDNLDSLGPVLVTGSLEDEKEKSNGAGKSSIISAIVWCLFGRTVKRANPGDNIINFSVGRDCIVEIKTTDGWTIRRTRKAKGHDDLIVYHGDKDETRGTNKDAQKFILKNFNLDYEIFASSAFFMQSSGSFLEMGDVKRKEMLERLLGIDRLNVWSEVAKEKVQSTQLSIDSTKKEIDNLNRDCEKYKQSAQDSNLKADQFEEKRKIKIQELQKEIGLCDEGISKIDESVLKNAFNLWKKWDEKEEELKSLKLNIDSLKTEISNQNHSLEKVNLQISSANDILNSIPTTEELDSILFSIKQFEVKKSIIKNNRDQRLEKEKLLQNLISEKQSLESEADKLESQVLTLIDSIKLIVDPLDSKCLTCNQSISKEETDRQKTTNSNKRSEIKENALKIGKTSSEKRSQIELLDKKIEITKSELDQNEWTEEKASSDIASISPRFTEEEINERKSTRLNKEEFIKQKKSEIVLQKEKINKANLDLRQKESKFDSKASELQNEKPAISKDLVLATQKELDNLISRKNDKIKQKQNEIDTLNPYLDVSVSELKKAQDAEDNIKSLNKKVQLLINEFNHYQYIQKAYSDRKKIKSIIIGKLIPYFNQRIQYYLSSFDIDLDVKFTESLGFETKKWPFDLFSGGEQKRISVAIMFAMHDLWLAIYGRQCNIMALDEVDTALDESGAMAFVNIINNDFAEKKKDRVTPDTILVISHRNDMIDAFPRKIEVGRDEDRFSRILNVV